MFQAIRFNYGLLPYSNRHCVFRKVPKFIAMCVGVLMLVISASLATADTEQFVVPSPSLGAPGTTMTDFEEGTADMIDSDIRFTGWRNNAPLDNVLYGRDK